MHRGQNLKYKNDTIRLLILSTDIGHVKIKQRKVMGKIKNITILIIIIIQPLCAPKKDNTLKYTSKQINTEQEISKLKDLFLLYESDIKNAVKVIIKNDMINSLNHLFSMNSGGRKYYLLERETLSEMIKAVTEGLYKDFILINNNGTIIYSMDCDDIFGKNVFKSLIDTPIYKCFLQNKINDTYIKDISIFPPLSQNAHLFISMPVGKEKAYSGVFILQIDISKIKDIFENETIIIGYDGRYRISPNGEKTLIYCPISEKIDFQCLSKNSMNQLMHNNRSFIYSPFIYKNLSWIVVSEKKDNSSHNYTHSK